MAEELTDRHREAALSLDSMLAAVASSYHREYADVDESVRSGLMVAYLLQTVVLHADPEWSVDELVAEIRVVVEELFDAAEPPDAEPATRPAG